METKHMSSRGSTIGGFILGAAAVAIVGGIGLWFLRGSNFHIDTSRTAVIHDIRQLQRLEAVVYGMDKIVSGGQESRYLPRLLAGDRLLLIVYGEVTAGVDLGKLEPAQLDTDGRHVLVHMPAAEIFATRIDNDRTRVYSRETGLFTSPDPNLESEVRREAEHQIRQAALDRGILEMATTNARGTLKRFLEGLGFESVEVR